MPAPITVTHTDITTASDRRWYPNHVFLEWWAEQDGVTVGYMKTHTYPDAQNVGATFVLCDIEVRDGYQGQGIARTMVEHAQAEQGALLHTTGSFTPKGAAALMGKLPVLPGCQAAISFDDMTFVHDWDARIGPR